MFNSAEYLCSFHLEFLDSVYNWELASLMHIHLGVRASAGWAIKLWTPEVLWHHRVLGSTEKVDLKRHQIEFIEKNRVGEMMAGFIILNTDE